MHNSFMYMDHSFNTDTDSYPYLFLLSGDLQILAVKRLMVAFTAFLNDNFCSDSLQNILMCSATVVDVMMSSS